MNQPDNNNRLDELKTQTKDEVSLKDIILLTSKFLKFLKSNIILIISIGLIGGLLGVIYGSLKKPLFMASTTFILEDNNTSSNNFSALASLAGVNMGVGASKGLFQGDNLIELYKSKSMIRAALSTEVVLNGSKDFLINQYIKVKNLREKWNEDPKLKSLTFNKFNINDTSRIRNAVLDGIIGDIRTNVLKLEKLKNTNGIFSVNVISPDEQFSYLFNNQIVSTVNNYYITTRTQKSMSDINILKHQIDTLKNSFRNSINSMAMLTDVNPNPNLSRSILKAPSQARQFDAEANRVILTQLIPNLEAAKVSLRRDTPLIQILESPSYPLDALIFTKFRGFTLGFVFFSFMTVLILSLKRAYKFILK